MRACGVCVRAGLCGRCVDRVQQSRFQTMSDQIIGRIDQMGSRIDDLEKSISDLMQQANIDADGN